MAPQKGKPERAVEPGDVFLVFLCLASAVACFVFKGWGGVTNALSFMITLVAQVAPIMLISMFMSAFVQVLVPRDKVSKWLGRESGLRGILIAIAAGAIIPGGPWVSFPLVLALAVAGGNRDCDTVSSGAPALGGVVGCLRLCRRSALICLLLRELGLCFQFLCVSLRGNIAILARRFGRSQSGAFDDLHLIDCRLGIARHRARIDRYFTTDRVSTAVGAALVLVAWRASVLPTRGRVGPFMSANLAIRRLKFGNHLPFCIAGVGRGLVRVLCHPRSVRASAMPRLRWPCGPSIEPFSCATPRLLRVASMP